MIAIDWVLVLVVALEAAGLIQWFKTFIKAPGWVWGALLPLLCLCLTLAPVFVHIAVLAIAVAQLGYEAILKAVLAKAGLVVQVTKGPLS